MFHHATQKMPLPRLPVTRGLSISQRIRLFVLNITAFLHQKRLEKDLARLVETSPHLLSDIGFVPDAANGTTARIVRTPGSLRVEIVP